MPLVPPYEFANLVPNTIELVSVERMPLHYPGRNTDSQTPIAQPCGRTPKEQDRSSETASIQLLAPKFLAAHLIPPTEWHVFRGNYMPLMQIAVEIGRAHV